MGFFAIIFGIYGGGGTVAGAGTALLLRLQTEGLFTAQPR